MKFREILQHEKENMPSYQWKFNKFLWAYIIVLLGGALVALVSGLLIGFLITDEGVWCFIPEFVWFGAIAVMSVVLVVKSRRVKEQLCGDIAKKLTNEFYAIDYQEAKQKLIEQNIITEEGFVNNNAHSYVTLIVPFEEIKDGVEPKIIPFEKVSVVFNANYYSGKLFLGAFVQCEKDSLAFPEIDNSFYNFLINNVDLISNKKVFALFCDDKEKFVRLIMRYKFAFQLEKVL